MRDLATMTHGEPVAICDGLRMIKTGTYAGFDDGAIVVDLGDTIAPVRLDANVTVEDADHNVIGLVTDDPALPNTIPERE